MDTPSWHPSLVPPGEGQIQLLRHGGWWELRLDNPAARNAVSPRMMIDLERAIVEIEEGDPAAVVLSGEGGFFCAGGDLRAVRAHLLDPGVGEGMCTFMQPLLDRLGAQPACVIAAVEGAALGGGAELLTATDHVIAGESASVGFVHASLGLSPGWGGAARLRRRVGARAAYLWMVTAARLGAEEAHRQGLVDEVVASGEALPRAIELARMLAALPREAVRSARPALSAKDPAGERAVFANLWGGPAHRQALGMDPGAR